CIYTACKHPPLACLTLPFCLIESPLANLSSEHEAIMRQSISTHVVGRLLLLAALVTGLLFSAGSLPAHAQPARQASYYTVQPGDSWAGIAASFGVPVRLIWQANGVTNPAALAAGQELFIPAHRSGSQPVIAYDITSAIVTSRAALESGNLISSLLLVNGVS